MQYIGIDIAKHAHVAAARLDDGTPHGKAFEFANDEEGFGSLLKRLRELDADQGSCLVVMESTGHYWMSLWSFLDDHGFGVAIVNPILIDAFRKADTVRKTKTDLVEIREELARTRQRGYCVLFEELSENKSSLAAPIFDRSREPIAAISISTSAHGLSKPQRERELAKAVVTAAGRISGKLGYYPK